MKNNSLFLKILNIIIISYTVHLAFQQTKSDQTSVRGRRGRMEEIFLLIPIIPILILSYYFFLHTYITGYKKISYLLEINDINDI